MKAKLRVFVFFCLTLFVGFNIYLAFTNQWVVYKILYYNLADLDDYKIFENRAITPSSAPFKWQLAKNSNQKIFSQETQTLLEKLGTKALLVIKNDTIIFEQYKEDYDSATISNSFSMAKSYVSTLIGIALKQGKIKNLDEPIARFIKEFDKPEKSKITIRHCLMMSSGLNWKENYFSPFSSVSQAYYGDDIEQLIYKLEVEKAPGQMFEYKGSDTQILGFVLEKIYQKPLAQIMSEQLWQPTGASHEALWSLDKKDGKEKASCCLNAIARDFALLGRLYLKMGNWNQAKLIDTSYILQATSSIPLRDKEQKEVNYYGFQWWILPEYPQEHIFYARGIGGQYIIVIPSQNIIVVRLGKKRGNKKQTAFEEVYVLIDDIIRK